jgi:putative heme transporter
VSIHPLAVVLAISTGGVLAGIVGALLAVPTVAFLNNAIQVLLAPDPSAAAAEQTAAAGDAGAIVHAKPDSPDDDAD